jgi:hypothetical protein
MVGQPVLHLLGKATAPGRAESADSMERAQKGSSVCQAQEQLGRSSGLRAPTSERGRIAVYL